MPEIEASAPPQWGQQTGLSPWLLRLASRLLGISAVRAIYKSVGPSQGPVDFGPYAQEHIEPVSWHGHEILVPPIELHIAPNEARNRHERVAQIREYLSNRG